MAKTPKVKGGQPKSIHSRAARRAVSPSVDLDKSLTSLPRPEPSNFSALAAQSNASVSKKKKNKAKTRAQKLRQQKGIERAEVVMDQLEKKVAKSVGKGKKVKARKAAWEELNRKPVKVSENPVETDGQAPDEVMDDGELHPEPEKSLTHSTAFSAVAQNPVADEHAEPDEDDEIT
ncbi:hypothetical protein VTN00DRAFT_4137 [Thermoascus crustaceus]|uniref:uncharacterized protein n=1 Tax=Thermoascus crustaceus TaxID=5088 RepID=UPI003741F487